ncbi:disulfide bond formation protein B [Pseudaminobacter sp. 19-2017]|uniref:Disulfide bond formation protein B n=1 Tax=Pseudaminobacter soli (ex Zhang et al. 2022) TaxID=2831468 RepID=A0A942I3X4_9HYPH|nr:disulfide bond formation protein B [Pseudaminobacter soli]MBS3651962.1 disulfide bond formation protein B [Pseudaminobacter soli]
MSDVTREGSWPPLFAAFAIALAASLSVLFVGEVMGQVPCNLCWFQRAFMFPLAVVLGLAALRSETHIAVYGIALAVGGWLVAGFHTLLYAGIIPDRIQPCTATGPSCSSADMTILGMPLPALSLGAFSAIIILLLLSRRRSAP